MRLFVAVSSILLLLAGCKPETGSSSVYDRVIATHTLRCGYIVYPPNLIKDVNTGKFSGISYDIITRLAHDLGLEVKWVEEVGTASMIEGLNTDRYDLLCTNVWTDSRRGRAAQFTEPLYFTSINAYAQMDDDRFVRNLTAANQPMVTIATLDGGLASRIASEDYPQAKTFTIPELTDFSALLLNVSAGKADLTFSEAAQAHAFERNNPGRLRNITPDHPVRLFANAFMMKMGEQKLAEMLNNAISNLHYNGVIEQIVKRHENQPGEYRLVVPVYR